MKINILLFGPQAELVGARELSIELPEGSVTAAGALEAVATAAPVLRDSIGQSRLAVNHEFVASDRVIRAEDEVALIGMVSGG